MEFFHSHAYKLAIDMSVRFVITNVYIGIGKFNYCLVLLGGVVLTAVVLEWLGIGFVLTVAQCDMKLTTKQKGILSGVGFAGT